MYCMCCDHWDTEHFPKPEIALGKGRCPHQTNSNHLIFWGVLGFFLKTFFLFSSDRKPENFFSPSESQNIFFQVKAKINFLFSQQHICSKCILIDLYVRVFLEPNIHGYIVYMFMHILDIGSECICTY